MTLQKTTKAGLEFAAHIFAATAVLLIVGVAAVGLGYFHHWLTTFPADIVAPWMPKTVQVVEYGLFVIDIVTFTLYVGVNTFGLIKSLFK